MTASKLQTWFPWVQSPVICNAPMLGAVSVLLAVEVIKAGGIGFIAPPGFDLTGDKEPWQTKLENDLSEASRLLVGSDVGPSEPTGYLPISIGFITAKVTPEEFMTKASPSLKKHRPAAVWLFGPDVTLKPHTGIIAALKALEFPPRVFVQTGNVAAAREAVLDGADVVVCQGIDAGGHQFINGAGVISLVPEVEMMLDEEFPERDLCIVAAGGIADGRGVAGALALGADGAVMGTRFAVSQESIYPEVKKRKLLETSDGGLSTLKSTFHDEVVNAPVWAMPYDGRAIRGKLHDGFTSGISTKECQAMLKDDPSQELQGGLGIWAGTGVGLVRKAQPAGEIVKQAREQARQRIRLLASME